MLFEKICFVGKIGLFFICMANVQLRAITDEEIQQQYNMLLISSVLGVNDQEFHDKILKHRNDEKLMKDFLNELRELKDKVASLVDAIEKDQNILSDHSHKISKWLYTKMHYLNTQLDTLLSESSE